MIRLKEQLRKMWVRVTLYSIAGIALALMADITIASNKLKHGARWDI